MHAASTYIFAMLFVSFFTLLHGSRTYAATSNQSLEGQLHSLAIAIETFLEGDRLLRGQKLRLDRVSSSGIPDANFDRFIFEEMSKLLSKKIDQKSLLLLKLDYSYMVSETLENSDTRVIQLVAKILDRGRTKLSILREVNNSVDISRIIGNTILPLDTSSHQQRLLAAEAAFEAPSFQVLNGTQVATTGSTDYSLEVRKCVRGHGSPTAIEPFDESGKAFTPIGIADTYHVVLFNYSQDKDAIVKLEIDGLDTLNCFNADLDRNGNIAKRDGYFIPRASSRGPGMHIVTGWFHTISKGNDNVFSFVVNELGKGAASAMNVYGKTGVITAQFFQAYAPNEKPIGRQFGETGKGHPLKQDYKVVERLISSEPDALVTVRYSRKPDED